MKVTRNQFGFEELRAVRRESRALFWAAGVFSAFVNLLMLTGPLYMLQVYDRVLGSAPSRHSSRSPPLWSSYIR